MKSFIKSRSGFEDKPLIDMIMPSSSNEQQQSLYQQAVEQQPLQQNPDQEEDLPPTKIKRSYKCDICDHLTLNPRVHLRHRIQIHGHKIRIVNCPFCVYACQYRQKLNRHLKLVHHYPPTTPPLDCSTETATSVVTEQPLLVTEQPVLATEQPVDLSYPYEIKLLIRFLEEIQKIQRPIF